MLESSHEQNRAGPIGYLKEIRSYVRGEKINDFFCEKCFDHIPKERLSNLKDFVKSEDFKKFLKFLMDLNRMRIYDAHSATKNENKYNFLELTEIRQRFWGITGEKSVSSSEQRPRPEAAVYGLMIFYSLIKNW